MAQDDNLRDDTTNQEFNDDTRVDETRRSGDDRVDETLQNQGLNSDDLDRRSRDELSDDMSDDNI